MIIAAIAVLGLLSIRLAGSDKKSKADMIEPSEGRALLKINCQIYPRMIPPMRLGRKKPTRYTFLNLRSPVTNRASTKATIFMTIMFKIVYKKVIPKEYKNDGSFRLLIKFSKPTNLKTLSTLADEVQLVNA